MNNLCRLMGLLALCLCTSSAALAQGLASGNCSKRNYTGIGWVYTPQSADFSQWLAQTAAGSPSGFLVATKELVSDDGGPVNLVCGTSTIFKSNSVNIRVDTAPGVNGPGGANYGVKGFEGIGFKVKVHYNDTPLLKYDQSTPLTGLLTPNQSPFIPPSDGNVFPNFGNCVYDFTGWGASACSYAGGASDRSNANSTMSLIGSRSQYIAKTWRYELYAYKLNANAKAGQFTLEPNFLPQVKVDGKWSHVTTGNATAELNSWLYCIGCAASGGNPPSTNIPASCSMQGGANKTVPLNPNTVSWEDFTLSTNGVKATTQWTPFTLQLTCANDKNAPVNVKVHASDAVTTSPASVYGLLANQAQGGANAGVQVFYKTAANASCSGSPDPSGARHVQLNRTQPEWIAVTSSANAYQPAVHFCARYYTAATSSAALGNGAVTSTMNYTFQYE